MYKNSSSVLLSPAGAAEVLKVKRHLWPYHLYPDPNPGPGIPYSAVAGLQGQASWAGLPAPALVSHVTWGESLKVTVTRFPHL